MNSRDNDSQDTAASQETEVEARYRLLNSPLHHLLRHRDIQHPTPIDDLEYKLKASITPNTDITTGSNW